MFNVAALYVDSSGHYPEMARTWFGAEQDARNYRGDLPVVAHPPCGPWGRLRQFCTKDDPDLALHAVKMVRTYGGVLEHPANSKLWAACDMPQPFGLFPDDFGGRSVAVFQSDYGHRAPKLTWLYGVGVDWDSVIWSEVRGSGAGRIEFMGHRERRLTPVPFAELLCQLAESAL